MTIQQIWILLLGYAVGSIPVGVLVAKRYGVDLMKVGSGNVGATNVGRVIGKGPGLFVFLMDVAKGWIPGFTATMLGEPKDFALLAGISAIIGHSFSPFLKFKGGKGIATGLGAFLGSTPIVALSAFSVFLVLFGTIRWVSVGSLAAAVSLPIFGFLFKDPTSVIVGEGLITIFIWIRHIPNIKRLMAGTEPKFRWGGSRGIEKGAKPVDSDCETATSEQ